MNPAYLVLDQGGHSTRALVYDQAGRRLFTAQASVSMAHPLPGWYEQAADEVRHSLATCLETISAQLASQAMALHSIALITQRSSLIACTKTSLSPLTPIISWQDTRNQAWLAQKIQGGMLDVARWRQMTGLRLNAHYGASKMRWLLDHHPAVQRAAQQDDLIFLPLAAYLAHHLTRPHTATDIPVVDAVSASRTFLCELGQQQWSHELMEIFSIDESTLPTIVPTRHTFGNITLAGKPVPLTVVGGDQSFLPFAYGKNSLHNALFVNAGTGAFVQAVLPEGKIHGQLLCSVAAIDTEDCIRVGEGTVNACSAALDWLFAQEKHTFNHEQIARALSHVMAPPVFYHRITALGSPFWLPVGTSIFSGGNDHSLEAKVGTSIFSGGNDHSLEAKTVAVIESIAFLLKLNMDLLQPANPALEQIHISGGFSHLDGFCQKLANLGTLPVIRCVDTEASSRGAALYLANLPRGTTTDIAENRFTPVDDASLTTRYHHFGEWIGQA